MPPAYGQQGAYQQPYAQAPFNPNDPGNTPAVVSLVLGVVSIAFLFFTLGISTIFSLGLGIAGIVLGQKGRKRVADGATTQHRDLATAGFAVSIGATILSVIVTLIYGLIVIGIATSDDLDSSDSTDNYFDTLLPPGAVGRTAAVAGHTLATLLA